MRKYMQSNITKTICLFSILCVSVNSASAGIISSINDWKYAIGLAAVGIGSFAFGRMSKKTIKRDNNVAIIVTNLRDTNNKLIAENQHLKKDYQQLYEFVNKIASDCQGNNNVVTNLKIFQDKQNNLTMYYNSSEHTVRTQDSLNSFLQNLKPIT